MARFAVQQSQSWQGGDLEPQPEQLSATQSFLARTRRILSDFMVPPVNRPVLTQGNLRRGWFIVGLLTVVMLFWLVYRSVGRPAWPHNLPNLLFELLELGEVAGVFTITGLWVVLSWRWWRFEFADQLAPPVATPTISQLYELSPVDFERYVASLFRWKGYRVTRRGSSGDLGVDLEVVDMHGRHAVVQCKRYQNTVGAEIVRELYGTFIHEEADHAYLVTTGDISLAARDWANGKPMTLIDGRTLVAIAEELAETERRPLSRVAAN